MKYKIMIVLVLFLNLFSYKEVKECSAKENPGQTVEVVVLLDTSASMENYRESMVEWAQNFCYTCKNENIMLSYITFDNRKNENVILKQQMINEKNCDTCMNKLQSIKAKGNDTDQFGSFKKAESFLKNSEADIRYIIMLSDGTMDYGDSKKEEDKADKAEKKLKTHCSNFTLNTEQKVILVGFGNNIPLFQDMEKESGAVYIDSSQSPAEITNSFFQGIDMPIKIQEQNSEEGELTDSINFNLDKKHYQTFIEINNVGDSSVKISRKKVFVYFDSKGKEKRLKKNIGIRCTEYSIKIALKSPKKGNYRISLPKSQWVYTISNQENYQISRIELKLLDDNKEVTKEKSQQDRIVCYEPDLLHGELKLHIDFYAGNEIINQNTNVSRVIYLNTEKEKSEKEWSNKNKVKKMTQNQEGEWINVLKEPLDEENNIYQARAFVNNSIIDSNSIKIILKEVKPEKISYTAVINKEVDLMQFIPDDYAKKANKLQFMIDNDTIENNTNHEDYIVEQNDNIIVFTKPGNHIINIQSSNNAVISEITITAVRDSMINTIKDNIIIVFFGIIIFIVVIVLILFIVKK